MEGGESKVQGKRGEIQNEKKAFSVRGEERDTVRKRWKTEKCDEGRRQEVPIRTPRRLQEKKVGQTK